MKSLQEFLSALVNPVFMSTGVKVAAFVGTILFTINHGSAVVEGKMTRDRWIAGLLTYFVPYSVNIHGQYTAKKRK